VLVHAKSGTVRILAVTGSRRSTFLPDVPTMSEAGYNVVIDSWLGVLVPAKTPPEAVNALSSAIGEAVQSEPIVESLAKLGNEPGFHPPDQFAAIVKADIARWGPVVKASGFVAED
jgi:tripartite-type tricarboxylate transporter receptor subunit TctC